jgi:hypothetical protein
MRYELSDYEWTAIKHHDIEAARVNATASRCV